MITQAGIQPQVWISIVGIVVAGAIALIVDMLRRKNEELRQAMADLQQMRLQEQPRAATPVKSFAIPAPAGPKPEADTDIPAIPPVQEEDHEAARKAASTALTEWLNKRSHKTAAAEPPQPQPASTTAAAQLAELFDMEPEQAAAELEQALSEPEPDTAEPVEQDAEPVFETAAEAASEPAPSGPEVVIDEALLAAMFGPSESAPKSLIRARFEVIEGAGGIPAGMHDAETLARLVDGNKPFTGLVFALCMTNKDGRAAGPTESASLYHFVRGLLRKADFGCQTGAGEFVLLLPEQSSARLSEIMEQLWDYQLRGIGSFSVLFSWGDALVTAEPLADAIDSATERMHQTRRSRKTVCLELAPLSLRSAAAKAATM